MDLNIVLVEPEIPQNTGNIASAINITAVNVIFIILIFF